MLLGERIVVVGSTGSGKTSLAKRLAEALRLPLHELDAIHWGPNWTPRPDFPDEVRAIIAGERWMIEGNYRAVRDAIWARATTLIWLNYSFSRTFWQIARRSFVRAWRREELWGGNRETFRRAFFDPEGPLWWLVHSFHRRRREYPQFFERFPQAVVIELRHPRDAEALIQRVQNGA